jgi:hypothetical protein
MAGLIFRLRFVLTLRLEGPAGNGIVWAAKAMLHKAYWICTGILCGIAGILTTVTSSAQIHEAWRTVITNSALEDYAVDSGGAVVVVYPTGDGTPQAQFANAAAVTKIDVHGGRLWTTVLAEMNLGYREPGCLALDTLGNTYIVGRSNYPSSSHHLHKLNSDGQPLWRADEQLSLDSRAFIATDTSGNVALAGAAPSAGGPRLWLGKYSADGSASWRTNFSLTTNGSSGVAALVSDMDGNWLLHGWAYSNSLEQIDALIKVSSAGQLIWIRQGTLADGWGIEGFHLAADGNIFVSTSSGLQKLNSDGITVWSRPNQGKVIYADPSGGLLISEISGTGPFSVARMSQDGETLWRLPLKRPPFAHAIDALGRHVLATLRTGYWSDNVQLAAVDASGEMLWMGNELPFEQSFGSLPGFFLATDGAFRVVAQARGTPQPSSVVAALQPETVTGRPRFIQHPTNLTGVAYQSVQFQVETENAAHLQWYRGSSPLYGETNSTLTLNFLTPDSGGDYYAEARNPAGAVFSQIGKLRVVYPPYEFAPPRLISLASNASMDVQAFPSGTAPFTFRWQRNGVMLPGQTNAVLRLRNVQADDAGDYVVVISNEVGAITNLAAIVRVVPGATEVWRDVRSISNCCDQACEQLLDSEGGLYLAHGNGLLKYALDGSVEWATNDQALALVSDGAGGVIYSSYAGRTRLGAQGQDLWHLDGGSRVLSVWSNSIVTAGDRVWLSDLEGMFLDGLTPDCENCRWEEFRILQPDAGNSLICGGLVGTNGISADLGVAKLNRAGETLWFARPGIPLNWWEQDQFGLVAGPDGGVTVAAVVGVGDWPFASYQLIVLRLDAGGQELWRNVCAGLPWSGSAQVALDVSGNAVATGPGCIVKYDRDGRLIWRSDSGHPRFGVHFPASLALDDSGNIYVVGSGSTYWRYPIAEKLSPDGNSLWVSALPASGLTDVDAAGDGAVYVSVANDQSSGTFRFLEQAVAGAPRILSNPEPSLAVLPCGAAFTASASAAGEGTLQYQWFFQSALAPEAVALPGATNQTLTLSNLWDFNSGQYFLEVRNSIGVAATRPVTLDVGYVPQFAVVDDDSSILGDIARVNSGGSVRFQPVPYGDQLPTRWQWFFNGNLVPDATNILFEVTNAASAHAGVYTLVGANTYGASTNSLHLFVEERVRTVFETSEAVGRMEQYENPGPLLPRLAVNSANEVYLLGTEFSEAIGFSQWFVSKYSADGARLWRVQQPGMEGGSIGVGILLDANENIVVAANDEGFAGMYLLKLGPDGDVLWRTNYLDAESFHREAHALVSNPQGNLFLGGMGYDLEDGTNALFVIKLTSDGERLWEVQAPHDASFGDWANRSHLAPANDGGVYAAGNLGLTRFSGAGTRLWERAGEFRGLTLDPSGTIYAARGWAELACFAPDSSPLWTSDWAGTAPLADGSGVFTSDLYRVFRHSVTGAVEWSSYPSGGTALALAQGGGCYVSRCLESKVYTRKLDANGSETWLATAAAPSDLSGYGSAVSVCPNGDVVAAHLLVRSRTLTEPTASFYLLQRLRESTNIIVPTLRISPAQTQAVPGERVCFTAQFNGGPAGFQWFLGSYPLFGETNATLCSQSTSWFWQDVWVQAVTDDGGFASSTVQLELLLPYIGPPVALTNDRWRIPIWSKWSYLPLVLESSTNLLQWEEISFWQNTYSYYFYFDFPRSAERQRYFRVRQIVP